MALTKIVLLFLTGITLLTVAYFDVTVPYYYRATIGFFGIFLWALSVFLVIRMQKAQKYSIGKINLRIRYCVLLIIVGSFVGGAVSGIMVYDTYWGLNSTLYKLSISFNINSSNNAPVYMGVFTIGVLIATFGSIILGRKFSLNTPNPK